MTEFEIKRALLRDFREQRDRDRRHIDVVDEYGIRLSVNYEDVTEAFQKRRRELLEELDGIITQLEQELSGKGPE